LINAKKKDEKAEIFFNQVCCYLFPKSQNKMCRKGKKDTRSMVGYEI